MPIKSGKERPIEHQKYHQRRQQEGALEKKIVVALLLFILCEDMMEKMAGTLLSFNGITMPAVMPIALTRMDFGPLNDF